MRLANLTDEELVLHALNAYNPMTSTDLEVELTNRLERRAQEYSPFTDLLTEKDIEVGQAVELLARVLDAEVFETEELRLKLEMAAVASELLEEDDPKRLRTAIQRALRLEEALIGIDLPNIATQLQTLASTTTA